MKPRLCRCEIIIFVLMKFCANAQSEVKCGTTHAGTLLAKQTSHTEDVLCVLRDDIPLFCNG